MEPENLTMESAEQALRIVADAADLMRSESLAKGLVELANPLVSSVGESSALFLIRALVSMRIADLEAGRVGVEIASQAIAGTLLLEAMGVDTSDPSCDCERCERVRANAKADEQNTP